MDFPGSANGSAEQDRAPIVVLGAGPAGLTAGYLLSQAGRRVLVLESGEQVGGLAKTVEQDGFRFDIGGHRFFTKDHEVEALWHEVLGSEFLERTRMSRIYWNGKFLNYPLTVTDVIRKLGPVELSRCALSYARAAARPSGAEDTFEQWVCNRFGRRLFELFFRSYTEKVWGVPCSEIRAEWAGQRIRDLSFLAATKAALFGNGDNQVKSLIERFHYPRLGPGQMWEAMTRVIEANGGEVRLRTPVRELRHENGRLTGVLANQEWLRPEHVISSLALQDVVAMASPQTSCEVREAAQGLRYRDFLTVALVLDGADPFLDNWIYIHEPAVRVARIQNYRSWSPFMVPDPAKACVGMEYFCFEGDQLWRLEDDALIALAVDELNQLGLADRGRVAHGYVVRVPKAYPMYDAGYRERVRTIRGWLDTIGNLQQVGRNGLHRYNNSDHSSLTAMRAVDRLLTSATHDIWDVNVEPTYHEADVRDERRPTGVPPKVDRY